MFVDELNILKLIKVYFFIISIILLYSCAKEESRDSNIPYSRVEININIILENAFNNGFYSKIYHSNEGGVAYAGYAGVVAIVNEDASLMYAYDICCPYEAPQKNILEVKPYETKGKCPKCGSVYDLMNGGRVESGPSQEKLRQYRVFKESSFYRIYN